jgi:hypothetical protein
MDEFVFARKEQLAHLQHARYHQDDEKGEAILAHRYKSQQFRRVSRVH